MRTRDRRGNRLADRSSIATPRMIATGIANAIQVLPFMSKLYPDLLSLNSHGLTSPETDSGIAKRDVKV